MIHVIVLCAVVVLAVAALAAVVWIEQRRISDERKTSKGLRTQLIFDEQQLDLLLGPRSTPDLDDPHRTRRPR